MLDGATQLTVAAPSPTTAVTDVGLPGTVLGVIGEDASEGTPEPNVLEAVTAKVYGIPLVRPVTVQPVAVGEEQVRPPGDAVTR